MGNERIKVTDETNGGLKVEVRKEAL